MEDIKKQIVQSGIPLQTYSSLILNKLSWNVKHNCFFDLFNRKENDMREIDVLAERKSFIPKYNNLLIIECKKDENKPWIFFEQVEKIWDPYTISAIYDERIYLYDVIKTLFKKFHYYNKSIHTYFFTPFTSNVRKNENISPIYRAIKQVMAGLLFMSSQQQNFINRKPQAVNGYFLFPIIVFDGELYSSKISEDGEIHLQKSNHISLLINFEHEEPWILKTKFSGTLGMRAKRVVIDIVKKEYFEEFLKNSFPEKTSPQ